LPFRKWDVALELMDYTDLIDPYNTRTGSLRGYVSRVKTLTAQMEQLEAKRRDPKQKLTPPELFMLGRCYADMGRVREGAQLVKGLVDAVSDMNAVRAIADILLEAKMDADAEKALDRYLKARPSDDVGAWIDLAKIQFRSGRKQASVASFNQALRVDVRTLQTRLGRDQELQAIYAEWDRATRHLRKPQTQTGAW